MKHGLWGIHYSIDAGGCNENIKNPDIIREFVTELIVAIDMVAFQEPRIVHFAADDPVKAGYTLDQLIETSNICCHFCDETREAYFDVFSCKEFDESVVLAVFNKYFDATDWNDRLFERGAPKVPYFDE